MHSFSPFSTIYKLTLNNGKFYIGQTINFPRRMNEHKTGFKSAKWVNKYGYISSQKLIRSSTTPAFDETRETLKLMLEYGLNNVRGAEYCQLKKFKPEDCRRMSYAIIHHLDGLNQKNVENKLLKSIENDLSYKLVESDLSYKLDYNLRNDLKAYREKRIICCGKLGLFYIFDDVEIDDICKNKPVTIDELSKIKGFTGIKTEKYGREIIAICRKYK